MLVSKETGVLKGKSAAPARGRKEAWASASRGDMEIAEGCSELKKNLSSEVCRSQTGILK